MKPMPIIALDDSYLDSVRVRLAARTVITSSGCWEWTGSRDRYGYGRFKVAVGGKFRQTGAHRMSWIAHRGPIPDPSLQTDHLCRNRACVNPDHMELVTNQVNTLRSDHSRKAGRSGTRPGLIHQCGRHGRADGYLSKRRNGYFFWVCRICRRARSAEYRARRRSA